MAKAVKKRWYKILAPKLFRQSIVGETPSTEASLVNGKTVKVNLFTLTNNIKKQNTEVSLLVKKVEGDKAITEMIGYRLVPNAVKRLVRKGRTRLDQTIKAITKDDKVITMKVLLVTRNLIQSSVISGLQKRSKSIVIKKIMTTNFDELAEQIVFGKFQRELREKLSKIYPLRSCEVRHFKLERFIDTVNLRKIKERLSKLKPLVTNISKDVKAKETSSKVAKPPKVETPVKPKDVAPEAAQT